MILPCGKINLRVGPSRNIVVYVSCCGDSVSYYSCCVLGDGGGGGGLGIVLFMLWGGLVIVLFMTIITFECLCNNYKRYVKLMDHKIITVKRALLEQSNHTPLVYVFVYVYVMRMRTDVFQRGVVQIEREPFVVIS